VDISLWWIVVAASLGLCAGIVLFALLTIASDREVDMHPNSPDPTPNP
jgi:hypothetical protein